MKVMESTELSARMHEALHEVEQGETIEVMRQGKVVARVVPVQYVQQSHLRRDENDAWTKLNILIDDISADWPKGISAQEAVNDVRRDL